MSILTEDRIAGPFDGDDSTSEFPFEFKVFSKTEMVVLKREVLTDEEEQLTLDSDYTVALNGDQETSPGGTITLIDNMTLLPIPLETGFILTLTSDIPLTQTLALTNTGGFEPVVINRALDRIVMMIQQLAVRLLRSAFFPTSDDEVGVPLPSALERANKVLSFDSAGNPEAIITVDSIIQAQANAETAIAQAAIATAAATAATIASNAAILAASQAIMLGSVVLYPSGNPVVAPFAHWLPLLEVETEVLKSAYPALYAIALLEGWAKNGTSGSLYMAIPSMAGYGIRITDYTNTVDPDGASRTNFVTGAAGNGAFSSQDHAVGQHTHTENRAFSAGEADNASGGNPFGGNDNPQTSGVNGNNVASETRMKNKALSAFIVAKLPGT